MVTTNGKPRHVVALGRYAVKKRLNSIAVRNGKLPNDMIIAEITDRALRWYKEFGVGYAFSSEGEVDCPEFKVTLPLPKRIPVLG